MLVAPRFGSDSTLELFRSKSVILRQMFSALQELLTYRRLGAKGSYLTLVRVADRIL